MRRPKIFLFAVVVTALPCATASAAGWTQPPEHFYLKVWDRTLLGKKAFTEAKTQVELPEGYQDHQVGLYGEYGLMDRLTLTLSAIPFGFAAYDEERRPYFGGGALGLRYQLYRGSWVAAVAAEIGGRPSSGDPLFADTVEGEALVVSPVVGTIYGGGSLEVGYGYSFGWLSAQAGARFFSNGGLDPAFFARAQSGWILGAGFLLDLHVSWYHALGDFRPINVLGAGQTRYVGVGLGASWWFVDWMAVTVGFEGAPFAVANAATPSLAAGFEFRR